MFLLHAADADSRATRLTGQHQRHCGSACSAAASVHCPRHPPCTSQKALQQAANSLAATLRKAVLEFMQLLHDTVIIQQSSMGSAGNTGHHFTANAA